MLHMFEVQCREYSQCFDIFEKGEARRKLDSSGAVVKAKKMKQLNA